MTFSDVRPKNPDSIRMNALQTVFPKVRVYGVSINSQHPSDSPTWVCGDVRCDRFWKALVTSPRNTKIVIVDYRWCPPSYWEPASFKGLGYGDRWFCHHIPFIFSRGVLVCILPNDNLGRVWAMYKSFVDSAPLGHSLHCEFLPPMKNPLYRATKVAFHQSGSLSWTISNEPSTRSHFSYDQCLRYCDVSNPFFVCYQQNETMFPNLESVVKWIDSLSW